MHCMLIANLYIVSYDAYINAQMVMKMFNDELLGLLMIIIEYLMIYLILMKLIVVNSLHREYLEMNGCPTMHCDVMYVVMDVFM